MYTLDSCLITCRTVLFPSFVHTFHFLRTVLCDLNCEIEQKAVEN